MATDKLHSLSTYKGFESSMSSIRNIQSRVQRQITVDTFYESELGQAIYSLGKHISRADNRTHQRRLQDRHPTNKKVSESSGNTTCYQ